MLLWFEHAGREYRIELTHRLRGAVGERDEVEVVFVSLSDQQGFQQGIRCALTRSAFDRLGVPPRSDAVLRVYRDHIAGRIHEIHAWHRARPASYFDLFVTESGPTAAPLARAS